MYKHLVAVAAAALISTGAAAQEHQSSHNPAMKNPAPARTVAPARGRNSFTESQAQGRIAKAGFAQVSRLTKDGNGVWQGTAMRNHARVHVALDYKGNVTAR